MVIEIGIKMEKKLRDFVWVKILNSKQDRPDMLVQNLGQSAIETVIIEID